jgi:hypothetical protein
VKLEERQSELTIGYPVTGKLQDLLELCINLEFHGALDVNVTDCHWFAQHL